MSLLGEQMISDQAVGLIELVKNAYDADATSVKIEISNVDTPSKTIVMVEDNGTGMSLADITEKWLSPATDHKEQAKQTGTRTSRGRLPIGEKGVGRFAVQQLGHHLELITRSADGDEIVVSVDWDKFEDGEFLDEKSIEIVERTPEFFKGKKTGTRLIMRQARSSWTEKQLHKVQRTLRQLQSPSPGSRNSIKIRLECPDYPEYENIDPADILDRAHYEFIGTCDGKGRFDYYYTCKHPGLENRTKGHHADLMALAKKEFLDREPVCGPFNLRLYVWDRTGAYMNKVKVNPKELDGQCGVSLFRDGLRVLPYGEPGDDWLSLDKDRVNAPSEKISNNQVIGFVEVDQENNRGLRDKTNREGMIENQEFVDLKILVRAALKEFHKLYNADKDKVRAPKKGVQHVSSTAMRQMVSKLHEAAETGKSTISVSGEGTVAEFVRSAEEYVPTSRKRSGQSDESNGKSTDVEEQHIEAADALAIIDHGLELIEAERHELQSASDRMTQLAGIGLAAERVSHEFAHRAALATKSVGELKALVSKDERACELLHNLEDTLAVLENEIALIAPYALRHETAGAHPVSLRDCISLAVTISENLFSNYGFSCDIEGKHFSVTAAPSRLTQVFDNLMNNAVYWLQATQAQDPRILFLFHQSERKVFVCDNGPGIDPEIHAGLFEPHRGTKVDGTGLGLYICKELLKPINAQIRLSDELERKALPSWVSGACFTVDFSKSS